MVIENFLYYNENLMIETAFLSNAFHASQQNFDNQHNYE